MTPYHRRATTAQTSYKNRRWPGLPDGVVGRTAHPHILPEGHLDKNFFPPIFEAVQDYMAEMNVAPHRHFRNLKSSQACCFNFLFPWRLVPEAAPLVLAGLLPGVERASAIEFEYTGPAGTTDWLGEPPRGMRGRNRTSADAAIWWEDAGGGRRLTLVEWKYTETEFGGCGGYKSRRNRRKDKCDSLLAHSIEPKADCYLESGTTDRTSRQYWERLKPSGVSVSSFPDVGCPFRGPFYQLLRLYLVRQFCQESMPDTDLVDVVITGFRDNRPSLLKTPSHLRSLHDNVVDAWNGLLTHGPPLRWSSVEDWLPSIESLTGEEAEWRRYIEDRYGV